MGALSSIAVSFQLPIVSTSDPKETAKFISALAKKEYQAGVPLGTRGQKGYMSTKERQEFVVEGLPNVSVTIAKRLLAHFGTVENITKASVKELCQVKGVGKQTAKEIRDNINADEVQNAPYNLSGACVTAGMWDNGSAATNHDDYNSRLTVGDGSSIGSHPAQVCGVMAGDGTRSTVYGGYANQWAGVAPGVDIASYSWPSDIGNMDSEHSHAISNYDIILSQNSWSWGLCPDYCEYYGE